MYLTWKKRLEIQSEYRDFNNWPFIEPNILPVKKRHQYIRNRQIIAKALNGNTLKSISCEFNLSISTIHYLLTRSLSGDDEEPPELTTALIPGKLFKSGDRKKPLSQCDKKNGARGSFLYILNTVPGLNKHLEEMLTGFVTNKAYSQNLTPKIFHQEFIRFLNDANWPKTTYPFDQEKIAYESCRKHFNKRIIELTTEPSKNTRSILPLNVPMIAYEEIQIDAQTTDLSSSIYIEINDILHSLRLSRLSLYLVKDVATDCNLAYKLCLTKDPNQIDVLDVLGNIHRPWVPLELKTPGLAYTEGACLPSMVIENSENIALNMVRMDNALCHMAHSIRDYVCYKLHATLNFGLPGQPKGRNYIEHGFDLISKQTHRFASTTGSHPRSPIKETKPNSKKPPLITLNALEEILSILITHHNIQPQSRLGGKFPLQLLKEHVAQHFVSYTYDSLKSPLRPNIIQKIVNVKLIKKENRRPHINFESLRYTGDCLTAKVVLNKQVIIEIDESDIRTLCVFSLKGKPLGKVNAPKSWQSHPHSVKTRKQIMKITQQDRLLGKDPLSGYFSYLLSNKELPKVATELIRVTREFGTTKLIINEKEKASLQEDEPVQFKKIKNFEKQRKIPVWSPDIENIPYKES